MPQRYLIPEKKIIMYQSQKLLKGAKEWFVHNPLLYSKKKEPAYARGELIDGNLFKFVEKPDGNIYWKRNGVAFYSGNPYDYTKFNLWLWGVWSWIKMQRHVPRKIYLFFLCLYTRNKPLYIKKGYMSKIDGENVFVESYFKGGLYLSNMRKIKGKWKEWREHYSEFTH